MTPQPIPPGEAPLLTDEEAAPGPDMPEGRKVRRELKKLRNRLPELGNVLRAERKRALLVILQSRDAAGKDGVVKKVFGAMLPQQLQVSGFEKPSGDEKLHDFLWRVHSAVPPLGVVGVFNRSHYEDVVAGRVRDGIDGEALRRRFRQINDFERMLTENGVHLLKIFLHVSRDEQRRRLKERLENPDERWEFDLSDLDDRERWDEFTQAYRDAMAHCGTEWAPWHLVPADDKPTRNLLVGRLVRDALERMDPQYPEPDYDVDEALARLE